MDIDRNLPADASDAQAADAAMDRLLEEFFAAELPEALPPLRLPDARPLAGDLAGDLAGESAGESAAAWCGRRRFRWGRVADSAAVAAALLLGIAAWRSAGEAPKANRPIGDGMPAIASRPAEAGSRTPAPELNYAHWGLPAVSLETGSVPGGAEYVDLDATQLLELRRFPTAAGEAEQRTELQWSARSVLDRRTGQWAEVSAPVLTIEISLPASR